MKISVDPETHALNQASSPLALLFILALIGVRFAIRAGAGNAGHRPWSPIAWSPFALGLLSMQRLEMFLRGSRLLGEARAGPSPSAAAAVCLAEIDLMISRCGALGSIGWSVFASASAISASMRGSSNASGVCSRTWRTRLPSPFSRPCGSASDLAPQEAERHPVRHHRQREDRLPGLVATAEADRERVVIVVDEDLRARDARLHLGEQRPGQRRHLRRELVDEAIELAPGRRPFVPITYFARGCLSASELDLGAPCPAPE